MTAPKHCPHCQGFPDAKTLGLKKAHRGREGRALVYEALRTRGALTIDEIIKAAWPSGKAGKVGTINVLLSRMNESLKAHGIVVLRGVGKDSTYRLGSI